MTLQNYLANYFPRLNGLDHGGRERGDAFGVAAVVRQHARREAQRLGGTASVEVLIRVIEDPQSAVLRISEQLLGQRVYDALAEAHHFPRLVDDTKRRIETLATHVRDAKAAFFQRVGLWVSVLFAPLAITASIFSGTHLSKRFADTNVSLVPDHMPAAGWLEFLLVFVVLSAVLGVLWLVMRWAYARESGLNNNGKGRDSAAEK